MCKVMPPRRKTPVSPTMESMVCRQTTGMSRTALERDRLQLSVDSGWCILKNQLRPSPVIVSELDSKINYLETKKENVRR